MQNCSSVQNKTQQASLSLIVISIWSKLLWVLSLLWSTLVSLIETELVFQNVRKQRKPLSVTSAYSKATYSRIEEDTEGSTEEDDWLLSDEEDEDEYRRGLSGPPSYVLERLPTSDNVSFATCPPPSSFPFFDLPFSHQGCLSILDFATFVMKAQMIEGMATS